MADEELTSTQKCKICMITYWKLLVFLLTPIIFIPVLPPDFIKSDRCMYIILVMAIYWITDAIPMYVTSLIPIALFPMFGILDTDTTCRLYLKDTVMFFLSGIILALAVQYSNLHKRIALAVVSCVGCSIKRLHVGLMIVTTFISNWQSNTATTAMMTPIVRAILEEFEKEGICTLYKRKDNGEAIVPAKGEVTVFNRETMVCSHISTAFYCSIAFASTIGGTGTIMGSGTNLVLKAAFETAFPKGPDIDFSNYIMYFYPVMLVLTITSELYLLIYYFGLWRPGSKAAEISAIGKQGEDIAVEVIRGRYKALGPMSSHEILVGIFFVLSISAVFSRKPGVFTGWSQIYPLNELVIRDASPLLLVVVLFFAIPASSTCAQIFRAKTRADIPSAPITIMNWNYVNFNTPWGLVFLLGGGFAIAEGMKASGMTHVLGTILSRIEGTQFGILGVILFLTEVITEFTANVPTANIILPIIAEMAIVKRINPLFLIMPISFACSMAFMTAVGTPPNAFVLGYAGIAPIDMAIAGLGVKVLSYFTLALFSPAWGVVIFPDMYEFPEWANNTS